MAYVGAVDQGTTSSRFIIFDEHGRIVAMDQKEHEQIYPKPGWVEHDPMEIWNNTQDVIRGALAKSGIKGSELSSIGITNQRETTVVWDRFTGKPYYNAIVWQCTRTHEICKQLMADGGQDRFRAVTGLPVATYFSGPKMRWILDNVPEARAAANKGNALFGTIETWIIWWLTGGPRGGAHVTDVTNASRTMLMDLKTLSWDEEILKIMDIPVQGLPRIVPSSDSETWGPTSEDGPLGARVPVCGAVGDQQAALVGQTCFAPGEAKNTYGTGCFLLMHTGHEPIQSRHGLIPPWPTSSAAASRPTAWRAPSPSPGPWCSGCATTCRCSRRPPRSRPWPAMSRTRAACTSCRPSRASTPPTGARTRAAPWSA